MRDDRPPAVAYLCGCGSVGPLLCAVDGCRHAVCGPCARKRGAWVCRLHEQPQQAKQPSLPL